MTELPFKRILLKLSGELLMGRRGYGFDHDALANLAVGIRELVSHQIQVGIVVGGGNIYRGIQGAVTGIPKTPSDNMGMLATLMNGIALQEALAAIGVPVQIMSALECPRIVESYTWLKARQYLREGSVVIFVGGTGNPYFTTDTAAALRANEIRADVLLKATKVDGIYDKDPIQHPDAIRFANLKYEDVLKQRLGVMDAAAIALCMDNELPVFVFKMGPDGRVLPALEDLSCGTLVRS